MADERRPTVAVADIDGWVVTRADIGEYVRLTIEIPGEDTSMTAVLPRVEWDRLTS